VPIHPQNWNFPNDFRTEVCVGHIASTTWRKKDAKTTKFFYCRYNCFRIPLPSQPWRPYSPDMERRKTKREGREVSLSCVFWMGGWCNSISAKNVVVFAYSYSMVGRNAPNFSCHQYRETLHCFYSNFLVLGKLYTTENYYSWRRRITFLQFRIFIIVDISGNLAKRLPKLSPKRGYQFVLGKYFL